ncbi:MAG: hypothetical protein FWG47_06560 [Propionibacteriaceae bacterium]|nr:hypothetical protein [Propionibacteriaceae bacterium]
MSDSNQSWVVLSPLLSQDPAKVGDFWLDARLTAAASGVAYVAHDDNETTTALIMLSEGAASDAAARDRLGSLVNQMHIDTVIARGGEGQDGGRLGRKFRAEDDDPTEPGSIPQSPWVALAYDGSPQAVAEATRILAEVQLGLSKPNPNDVPAGPEFNLHWINRFSPGSTRVWPLPWPGRHDRAGALSILASWLLMLLLAALAILIAILLFQQSSPQPPPPPVPTNAPESGSPPPDSPDPSDSESPEPSDSESPEPSDSESPEPSESEGSPTPSESGDPGGSPSPDSRL